FYKQLEVIEFSSKRKRMSVIIKTDDGHIYVFSKGADTVMFRYSMADEEVHSYYTKKSEQYSNEGLRTLVIAFKEISEKQFQEWHKEYQNAQMTTKNRAKTLNKVIEKMESDLTLLGIT